MEYATRDEIHSIDVVSIAQQLTKLAKVYAGKAISTKNEKTLDLKVYNRAVEVIDESMRNFISVHREIRLASSVSPACMPHLMLIVTEMLGVAAQLNTPRYRDIMISSDSVTIFFDVASGQMRKQINYTFLKNGFISISQEMCNNPIMVKVYALTPFGCSVNITCNQDNESKSLAITTVTFFEGDSLNGYLRDKDEWKIKKEEEK